MVIKMSVFFKSPQITCPHRHHLQPRSYLPDEFIFHYANQSFPIDFFTRELGSNLQWTASSCHTLERIASCAYGRCASTDSARKRRESLNPCFCDDICMELGDCCYDYVKRCLPGSQWQLPFHTRPSPKTCARTSEKRAFAMVSGCRQNPPGDKTAEKCYQDEHDTTLLSGAPVFDHAQNISYKNIYCAKCNNASQLSYWLMNITCENDDMESLWNDPGRLLKHVRENCTWEYLPSYAMGQNFDSCTPQDTDCVKNATDNQKKDVKQAVHDICNLYSLPIRSVEKIFKNPHCAICSDFSGGANCWLAYPYNPPAALNILFDFKTNEKYDLKILKGDNVEKLYTKAYSCATGHAYDLVEMTCKTLPIESQPSTTTPKTTSLTMSANQPTTANENITGGSTGSAMTGSESPTLPTTPCVRVIYKACDVTLLSNKSLLVMKTGAVYPKEHYTIRDLSVVVCVGKEAFAAKTIDSSHGNRIDEMQVFTYVGLALSAVTELVLLGVYCRVKEMRNIPGKNLMSFLAALLGYQIFYVLIGYNNIRELCIAVAIVIHYFFLASFGWMAVMAYDVMKTFTSKVCATLDKTVESVNIGYGQSPGGCWMEKNLSRLGTMHAPVSMVIVFNLVALLRTVLAIRKTQKTSRMARENGKNPLPYLIAKLSCVMGFTWILGLMVGLVDSTLVLYTYTILNSLQGFIVSLFFLSNKTTLSHLQKKKPLTSSAGVNDGTRPIQATENMAFSKM
ncbi:predicted protein [Nematostella vectensis]|uniref:G-protein coupled receptors family 2 profile 2 domain-containing protein n=1 Tax=Nematostella vectensis TaxID=45351 RepID=A7SD54_NEMVE|nr:predicted protein [Nematostella vectensis]|eukprot:XP_001630446.1 predicted protein [Nematostella vectensis]